MTDLGAMLSGSSSAIAITSAGDVVGNYWAGGIEPRAFLYRAEDASMIDLNELVPAGVQVHSVRDINDAGQILVSGSLPGLGYRDFLLTPKTLHRLAYAFADQKFVGEYSPVARLAHNGAGGKITIKRLQTGLYTVKFGDLYSWGDTTSIAVSVTAHGAGTIHCSSTGVTGEDGSTVVGVACVDMVTKAPADSRYNVMVTGNASVQGPSAFVMITTPEAPAVLDRFSWNGTTITSQSVSRIAAGVHQLLLGTGNTARSAKLVTATSHAGSTCVNARGISGGLEVKCYDASGALVDRQFSVVQVAGGRPGRRVGFALANLATTPSYTPTTTVSYNSSGGAITATRSAVGRYSITFAGLAGPTGSGEHVQVTPMLENLAATCKVVDWWSLVGNLKIDVECRKTDGQLVDTRYGVLVIE